MALASRLKNLGASAFAAVAMTTLPLAGNANAQEKYDPVVLSEPSAALAQDDEGIYWYQEGADFTVLRAASLLSFYNRNTTIILFVDDVHRDQMIERTKSIKDFILTQNRAPSVDIIVASQENGAVFEVFNAGSLYTNETTAKNGVLSVAELDRDTAADIALDFTAADATMPKELDAPYPTNLIAKKGIDTASLDADLAYSR